MRARAVSRPLELRRCCMQVCRCRLAVLPLPRVGSLVALTHRMPHEGGNVDVLCCAHLALTPEFGGAEGPFGDSVDDAKGGAGCSLGEKRGRGGEYRQVLKDGVFALVSFRNLFHHRYFVMQPSAAVSAWRRRQLALRPKSLVDMCCALIHGRNQGAFQHQIPGCPQVKVTLATFIFFRARETRAVAKRIA